VCAILFVVLLLIRRRKKFDGEVILAYTFLYGVARFILEFFRGDDDRGFVFGGPLSTSQFIAVILVPVAVVLWVVRRQRISSGGRTATNARYNKRS
jgi:phosphatidylglycerol:prolipoprotein diacylglycerol transferase